MMTHWARNPALYAALHAPMAIINGGSTDIAYTNGNADFEAINNIPIMVANIPVGHGGRYSVALDAGARSADEKSMGGG